ncbi:unnamed protein product [Sphagnum balticum]
MENYNLIGQLPANVLGYPNLEVFVLMITKGDVVGPALEFEHGIKQEMDVKPTIRLECCTCFDDGYLKENIPTTLSLNPYQGNWTIKVRVTSKGPPCSFKNAQGAGNVFNVELTDEDGTQILATMFKEAADKFFDKLQLGKVYFITKGSLRVANKQFSNVNNDYEMTLNANSEVEEVPEDAASIQMPAMKYKFVKINALGPYVNGRELVGPSVPLNVFLSTDIMQGEHDGIWVWQRVNQLFNWLPLVAVVERKISCMHGGIGRSINYVQQIEDLKRPITVG